MARKEPKQLADDAGADGAGAIEQRIATGLHKIGLALKHQTWLFASEDGLSPTQGQILAALLGDGPQTASELAKRLGLTLPTVSDSVRVLAQKRLVKKTPDPRHPRARLVHLTAAGRKQAASARGWPEFLATAVEQLTEAEQVVFLSGLIKMIRTLQETGQIPVSRMCVSCVHFRPNAHRGEKPHHCAFVDAAMADSQLRIDCQDHEPAPTAQEQVTWARFLAAD